MDNLVPLAAILAIFVGMPWLFLHYTTKWKQARGLSLEDEKLLDELFETARRLDERVGTIERIMTADNPGWRHEGAGARDPYPSPATPSPDRRH